MAEESTDRSDYLPEAPALPSSLIVPSTQKHHKTSDNFEPIRLHFAINKNDIELVKRFIAENAGERLSYEVRGNTPLTLSLLNQYTDIALLLIDSVPTQDLLRPENTRWKRQPIHLAVKAGSLLAVQRIVSRCPPAVHASDSMLFTPLHWAASHSQHDIGTYLIDAGAHVNARDDRGQTPLHRAIQKDDIIMTRLLLDVGASLEHHDRFGWTPIYQVVVCGMVSMLRFLLEQGTNVNVCDNNALTPLHVACDRTNRCHLVAVSQCNTDFYLRPMNTAGPTIHRAVSRDSSVDVEQIQLLLDYGALVNAVDVHGRTPLKMAAESDRRHLVEVLYSAGADLSLEAGWITPGDWPAAVRNDAELCDWLIEKFGVKVRPLVELCKFVVRRSLRSGVSSKIRQLPLPSTMIQFCCNEDVP